MWKLSIIPGNELMFSYIALEKSGFMTKMKYFCLVKGLMAYAKAHFELYIDQEFSWSVLSINPKPCRHLSFFWWRVIRNRAIWYIHKPKYHTKPKEEEKKKERNLDTKENKGKKSHFCYCGSVCNMIQSKSSIKNTEKCLKIRRRKKRLTFRSLMKKKQRFVEQLSRISGV